MILTREYVTKHLPKGMRLAPNETKTNQFVILYNVYQIGDADKESSHRGSCASLYVDTLPGDEDTCELFKARLEVALKLLYLADIELCEKSLEYKRKKLKEFNQAV
jgi:hypothetical protein